VFSFCVLPQCLHPSLSVHLLTHMTPHRDWFVDYTPHVIPIMVADGNIIHSAGIGKVKFQPGLRGAPGRLVVLHQVLHVPCLSRPLLSMLDMVTQPSCAHSLLAVMTQLSCAHGLAVLLLFSHRFAQYTAHMEIG